MEWCRCPLCGEDQAQPWRAGPDRLHGTPGTYQLVRCRNCRLVYLNPRPTLDEIEAIYPAEYSPHRVVRRRANPLRRLDIAYGMAKRARFVERYLPEKGRALDVGCATGEFLLELGRRAWQVVGVEISQAAAQTAIEAGLDVRVGTLEQSGLEASSYDLVTLWDVIEHLHDPVGALGEIRRLLKPAGLLVMSTPDLSALDARLFGDYWAGLDIPRHLCLFDPVMMSRLLEQGGFELVARRYLTGSYSVALMSARAWLRDRRWPAPAQAGALRLAELPLWRLLAWPLFRLAERAGIGPVMTVVAKPRSAGTHQKSGRQRDS